MTEHAIGALRQHGQDARRQLCAAKHAQYSLKICRNFLRSPLFFRADTIACYLTFDHEVDTNIVFERAWQAQKSIFVPVLEGGGKMRFVRITRNTRLERNRYGIYEPRSGDSISPKKLDVVVTPLVAFDNECNRIGMGGGYFDRCFSFLQSRKRWVHPKLAGFAFECQKVEKIRANPWDIRLYHVFSERD